MAAPDSGAAACYACGWMHYVERLPVAPLRPWVDKLWALRDAPAHTRERILPSGTFELVINLQEDEFRIYDGDDEALCRRFGGAIVSGAYDHFFGIDTREHASVLGVHFKPAGASALLGVPAARLRNAHADLDALWGRPAARLRERLLGAADVAERFRILEAELCERLAPSGPERAIALAVARLEQGAAVASVVAQVGFSHRRFIEAFGASVGLTPKAFARVRRFQRVVACLRGAEAPDWSALAVRAGYCDQSHLIREFIAISGLAPSLMWRASGTPVKEHHVALPASAG